MSSERGTASSDRESNLSARVKLDRNSVRNALQNHDIRLLLELYKKLSATLVGEERDKLRHGYLKSTAHRSNGEPVLRYISAPTFSRIFNLSTPVKNVRAGRSKRSDKSWDDLLSLADYWCAPLPAAPALSIREHAFYDAWLVKAKTGWSQQQSMREIVTGVYLMFRPSVLFPGRYVVGLMLIYVAGQHAVATFELNRLGVPPLAGAETSKPGPNALVFDEEHHGYALRKSGCLMIRSWEDSSGDEQVGVFSLFNDDDKKHTHVLDGHYLGMLSNNGPTTRTAVMLRQGDCPPGIQSRADVAAHLSTSPVKPLLSHVGMVTWDQLPDIVQARLSRAAGSLAIYGVPSAT